MSNVRDEGNTRYLGVTGPACAFPVPPLHLGGLAELHRLEGKVAVGPCLALRQAGRRDPLVMPWVAPSLPPPSAHPTSTLLLLPRLLT